MSHLLPHPDRPEVQSEREAARAAAGYAAVVARRGRPLEPFVSSNPTDLKSIVREALVARRKELAWGPETLAIASGRSRSTIGMYESGDRVPDLDAIEAVAKALGLRVTITFTPIEPDTE